jgi:hypothetical protein
MRESRTYGSVRGALSNERPYRDADRAHAKTLPGFACTGARWIHRAWVRSTRATPLARAHGLLRFRVPAARRAPRDRCPTQNEKVIDMAQPKRGPSGRGAPTERTRLTYEQKVYVVKRLAAYDGPVVIARGLKEEFGITVRSEVVQHYHPERVHGRNLAQHWKDLFWDSRKAYHDSTADIGADHTPVRIRWRGEMVQETWGAGQHKIANEILDSVAKEAGAGAGNRHARGHFGLRGIPLTATINIIRKPREP